MLFLLRRKRRNIFWSTPFDYQCMLQRNKAGLNRFSYQFDNAYLPQKVSRKLLHHFNAHRSNLRQPLFLNFASLLILLEDERLSCTWWIQARGLSLSVMNGLQVKICHQLLSHLVVTKHTVYRKMLQTDTKRLKKTIRNASERWACADRLKIL